MLIGVVCGTLEGLEGTMLYIFLYIIMSINVFSFLLALRVQGNLTPLAEVYTTENQSGKLAFLSQPRLRLRYITDLAGIGRTNPVLGIALALLLFSMAGVPPLAGFFGKFQVFLAAMDASFYGLALIGILTSAVGCFYYIRLIKIMYFDPTFEYKWFQQIDKENSMVLGITFFLLVLFIFYPSPFYLLSHKVVFALCA
jgi:NADH-quinone oxidoreductase subunit N